MQFEITHDFDIPRDAVELAVLSPDLVDRLAPRLPAIEKVQQRSHALRDGVLERVWAWKANVRIPSFAARYVHPSMCSWEERSTYRLDRHMSRWSIHPNVRAEWQQYFDAKGTYELHALPDGRTRRTVKGAVELRVKSLVKHVAERMIVGEVKRTFDAEAATLRDLATLG